MCKARLNAPSSADRTSSRTDVPTDGEVSTERECPNRVFAVEDDDKICDIRADLETPADTTRRDTGRGRPRAIW